MCVQMEKNTRMPSAEELLRKIQELEKLQSQLKQEISKLMLSRNRRKPKHQLSNSVYSHRAIGGSCGAPELRSMEPLAMKLTENQYFNILQSMDQAVHVFGRNLRIIFWNRAAEVLYGYTPAEACGKIVTELMVEPKDAPLAFYLLERTVNGESWAGEFPIKNNRGEKFVVIATNTPFRDEKRGLVGGMCISSDTRPYYVRKPARLAVDTQQSLQNSIASKISILASKVKLKMKNGDNYTDHGGSYVNATYDHSEASTQSVHIRSPFGEFSSTSTDMHFTRKITIDSGDESTNKPGIRNIFSVKTDAWMGKKKHVWPWKGDERELESIDPIFGRFGWKRLDINQEHEPGLQTSSSASSKLDYQLWENANSSYDKTKASGLWFSTLHASSTSSTSSSSSDTSNKSNAIIKVERETHSLDYEILWEDLVTGKQIGQGSCGTVYHAMWYGSVCSTSPTHQYIL